MRYLRALGLSLAVAATLALLHRWSLPTGALTFSGLSLLTLLLAHCRTEPEQRRLLYELCWTLRCHSEWFEGGQATLDILTGRLPDRDKDLKPALPLLFRKHGQMIGGQRCLTWTKLTQLTPMENPTY